MTPQEHLTRARAYLDQALGRLTELEAAVTVPADSTGVAVSLRANLESAKADLQAAARDG